MLLYQFAIAAAVSIALNLAISALTADYGGNKQDKAILKSSFGFPLEKPFGKVRLPSRNVFWGLPIEDSDGGGGKGFGGSKEQTSYATFAVMGGVETIERVTKIWLDSELIYEYAPGRDLVSYVNKKRSVDTIEVFFGSANQNPSGVIEAREGIGNVPAFKNRFYLVFKRLEVRVGGTYPTVDIEVETSAAQKTLPYILNWVCRQKGLNDSQIIIDPALNQYNNVNIDFEQSGETAADFIKELQQTYFFIVIDQGDRIIFRDYTTPESLPIVNLTLDNLAATEGNSSAIERYLQKIPDDLDLPSQVQFEYVSAANNYDLGLQPAYRYDAQHYNDLSFRTRQVLTDTEGSNIAWKTLGILWTQSRRLEKLMLLPSVSKLIEMGSLFTVPIDGVKTLFQVETKEIGDNDLVEISAVSYEKINPSFVIDNPVFPNSPIADIPFGQVIALDLPLLQDSDSDLGLYLGVESAEDWKYGTIFVSDNGGDSYSQLTNFTGKSTVGTVTQIPQSNNPDIIDYGSEIIIEIPHGGIVESIPEADFLNLKQMGLFGSEIIAWQNAQLIAPNTYKLTKLIRGLRGTERNINQHAINERFVLLKGTGARLIRVQGAITDLGKTLLFKAVHGGQTLDSVVDETSLTVTGEAIRPYTPVNPEILKDTATNDLTIEWTLRTRRYGQWRDGVDIVHSDTNQSTLEILDSNGTVVHTAEIFDYENPSYTFVAAQQIEKLGSLQTELNFNVYQVSSLIGRGYPLQARNIQPSKFV